MSTRHRARRGRRGAVVTERRTIQSLMALIIFLALLNCVGIYLTHKQSLLIRDYNHSLVECYTEVLKR